MIRKGHCVDFVHKPNSERPHFHVEGAPVLLAAIACMQLVEELQLEDCSFEPAGLLLDVRANVVHTQLLGMLVQICVERETPFVPLVAEPKNPLTRADVLWVIGDLYFRVAGDVPDLSVKSAVQPRSLCFHV